MKIEPGENRLLEGGEEGTHSRRHQQHPIRWKKREELPEGGGGDQHLK